jgi:hypothetical protein
MWICFNNAFVSAVEAYDDTDTLVVRARHKDHLPALFPDHSVEVHHDRDYRYRILVSKQEFAEMVQNNIMNINYNNFKDSVDDDNLHDLYADFWRLHYRYQHSS